MSYNSTAFCQTLNRFVFDRDSQWHRSRPASPPPGSALTCRAAAVPRRSGQSVHTLERVPPVTGLRSPRVAARRWCIPTSSIAALFADTATRRQFQIIMFLILLLKTLNLFAVHVGRFRYYYTRFPISAHSQQDREMSAKPSTPTVGLQDVPVTCSPSHTTIIRRLVTYYTWF